jgi:hypothetical protein
VAQWSEQLQTSKDEGPPWVFPKKPYTPAGFEPGSSILKADVMAIEPRRQGKKYY